MKTHRNLIVISILFALFLFSGIAQSKTLSPSGNEKTVISLPTIICESCVTRVEKALKKIDGVVEYKVDLDGKSATVTYDSDKTNVAVLETAITSAGYDANDKKADEKAYDRLPGCCKGK
jgi:copper chaperone CopZ